MSRFFLITLYGCLLVLFEENKVSGRSWVRVTGGSYCLFSARFPFVFMFNVVLLSYVIWRSNLYYNTIVVKTAMRNKKESGTIILEHNRYLMRRGYKQYCSRQLVPYVTGHLNAYQSIQIP